VRETHFSAGSPFSDKRQFTWRFSLLRCFCQASISFLNVFPDYPQISAIFKSLIGIGGVLTAT